MEEQRRDKLRSMPGQEAASLLGGEAAPAHGSLDLWEWAEVWEEIRLWEDTLKHREEETISAIWNNTKEEPRNCFPLPAPWQEAEGEVMTAVTREWLEPLPLGEWRGSYAEAAGTSVCTVDLTGREESFVVLYLYTVVSTESNEESVHSLLNPLLLGLFSFFISTGITTKRNLQTKRSPLGHLYLPVPISHSIS